MNSKPNSTKIPAELKVNQIVINRPCIPKKEPSKATNFSSPSPKTGLLKIFLPTILSTKKNEYPIKAADKE